jgi:membrane-associated phospholipid phosphatase
METLQQIGIDVTRALQVLSPTLDGVMNFFSFLGRIEFYLLFLSFIYWSIDSSLGMRALLVLIITDIWGTFFKLLFHQPRPYWIGGVKKLSEETTYGIPSIHASDSIAIWGYLGDRVRKNWLWVVAIVLIIFIGVSRIYLGVHFPHDVLFGWLLGGVIVWIFLQVENQVASWAKKQTILTQVGLGLVLSIVVVLIGQVIQIWLAGSPDPQTWNAYAASARTPTTSYTLSGALFGAISGYAFMKHWARFQSTGPWIKRIGRYALGIAVTLLIYIVLDVLFGFIAPDETAVGYGLRYVRYAVATFWLTFLAPWLFLRTKLAELEPQSV